MIEKIQQAMTQTCPIATLFKQLSRAAVWEKKNSVLHSAKWATNHQRYDMAVLIQTECVPECIQNLRR
jgi:hypothetical protein